jgi:glycyl-tRNA synthetase
MSIGEAVKTGLVNNETLGYFMARTQLFLEKIGMDPERLRFRQHLTTEMAHYATDCWDLEIQSSYGWIECVGHADRACFDLDVHSKVTKTPMLATQKLDKPQQKQVAGKLKLNRKLLGQAFKQDQRIVSALIEEVAEDWTAFQEQLIKPLEETGSTTLDNFTITKDMILSYKETTKTVHEIKFTPSVIEPSFGMGRILYSLLEHSFYQRKADEQRIVMKFNPTIAPTKCAVLPISSSVEMNLVVNEIATDLMESDLSTRVDTSSAALGRRYARSDEIGVPFAVTVDFGTLENGTVTLRERDSTHQIRLPKSDVTMLIFKFCHGKITWDQAKEQYPLVQVNEDGEAVDAPPTTPAVTTVEKSSRGNFSRPAAGTLPSK